MNIWKDSRSLIPFLCSPQYSPMFFSHPKQSPCISPPVRLLCTAAGLILQGYTIRTEPAQFPSTNTEDMHICCKNFLLPFLLGGPPTSGTLVYRTAASTSAQLPASPRHSLHSCHHWAQAQEVLCITGSQHIVVQFYEERNCSR